MKVLKIIPKVIKKKEEEKIQNEIKWVCRGPIHTAKKWFMIVMKWMLLWVQTCFRVGPGIYSVYLLAGGASLASICIGWHLAGLLHAGDRGMKNCFLCACGLKQNWMTCHQYSTLLSERRVNASGVKSVSWSWRHLFFRGLGERVW